MLPLTESSTAVSLKWCSLTDISVHRAHIRFFSPSFCQHWGYRDRLLLLMAALSCISALLATQSQLLRESEVMCRNKHFPNLSPHYYPLLPSPVIKNGEQRFPSDASVSNQVLLQFFTDEIKAGQIFASLVDHCSGIWEKSSFLLTLLVGSRVDEGVKMPCQRTSYFSMDIFIASL